MSIELVRVDRNAYRVFVGGSEYGILRRAPWDGVWIAYTMDGERHGRDVRTRDEALHELLTAY